MSTNLGTIEGRRDAVGSEQGKGLRSRLYLTRFFGGKKDGMCLQLTIQESYVQLDAAGIAKLRAALDEFDG